MSKLFPDYLKLFIRREGKVVLGRKYSNVWLLAAMLAAAFLAIAFANGSLNYLDFKMNDPFIKWVDIKADSNSSSLTFLESDLSEPSNQDRYHYLSHSYEYEDNFVFIGAKDTLRAYLKCRFFNPENKDLIKAVISGDNKLVGVDASLIDGLADSSIGVFITEKTARRLGYTDAKGHLKVPPYIDIYHASRGAEALGFHLVNGRARVPLPILAVVKKLPGGVDLAAFKKLYQQLSASTFFMDNEGYASSLCYFVPENVDTAAFDSRLSELIKEENPGLSFMVDDQGFCPLELYSFQNRPQGLGLNGIYDCYQGFRRVCITDTLTLAPLAANRINDRILEEYAGSDVFRVFDYDYSYPDLSQGNFLSVYFDNLKEIRAFAEELVEKNELEIEMTQINAKENFQSVTAMGIILSVVMVVFAVICILLFIVNLLQSYFQKVKRNIGTFKAFGISNRELRRVYIVIILALVLSALAISLFAVTLLQLVLQAMDIAREGGYALLSLWHCDVIRPFPSLITVAAVFIVIAAVIVTVYSVLDKLLSATPGDLIYDR